MEETIRKVSAIFDKMASAKITPTSNYSVPEYWMNRAIKGDEKCKDNLFNFISLRLNIDKSILNAVFNAKYNKTNENKVMNKKLIRLTESDLHKIVKESVNRIINEIGDTPKGQLALGAVAGRANVRGNRNTEIAASNKAWDNSASGKVRGTHYDSGYELGKDMERDKQQKQYIASRLKEDVIKESVKRVLSELDWKAYR